MLHRKTVFNRKKNGHLSTHEDCQRRTETNQQYVVY